MLSKLKSVSSKEQFEEKQLVFENYTHFLRFRQWAENSRLLSNRFRQGCQIRLQHFNGKILWQTRFRKFVFFKFRRLKKNFRTFCCWGCQDYILRVQRDFVRRIVDWKSFFTLFGHRAEVCGAIVPKISNGVDEIAFHMFKKTAWV